jgi:hypothetical protein
VLRAIIDGTLLEILQVLLKKKNYKTLKNQAFYRATSITRYSHLKVVPLRGRSLNEITAMISHISALDQ